MQEAVFTENAPKAIGPYSQAIKGNGFVFVSGQIGVDPASGNIISGGIGEQTDRVLKNLAMILSAAGSNLHKTVKTTVFLKNMEDFAVMNKIYAQYFEAAMPPARATVEVARLPKDVLVEIDLIALA